MGPLEAVGTVGPIVVLWQEVARVTGNMADIVRIGHVPPPTTELQDPKMPSASRHRSGVVLPMIGA